MNVSADPTANLLGMSLTELRAWVESQNLPAFRGKQIFKAIHQRHLDDVDLMTDLPLALRAFLKDSVRIQPPVLNHHHASPDGTRKWLLGLQGGGAVEAVWIPEVSRATLCVSSQVGCNLSCSFCHTGKQGFQRNLSAAEIIAQLWWVRKTLQEEQPDWRHPVTNIVFMGMGEPLLSLDAVCSAISIMRSDDAYGLSKRRVTVSTSGVVPKMFELFDRTDTALAVSLHAPNDELRSELVPINRKYPLKMLMEACHDYVNRDKARHVTMEYVMLKGVNDTMAHAKALVKLLDGLAVKMNLIPFNPFVGADYVRSTPEAIEAFGTYLKSKGLFCFVRKTRGDEISGACGQLAGDVLDRTSRQAKFYGSHLKKHVLNDKEAV